MISQNQKNIEFLLHDVAHQLRVFIDGKVEPFMLCRLKWRVLGVLEQKHGISQAEIADILDVERSSVGRVLERMEKKKVIRRARDEEDRRVVRVFLEEKAELFRLLSQMKKNLKFGCSLMGSAVVELLEQTYFLPIP